MTKPRNRIGRKNARRASAMARLQAGLNIGVRFSDKLGDCPHSNESRDRALMELNALTLALARDKPREGVRTKKDRSGKLRFSA